MIYSAGTIAISGAAVTGTGTNFTAAANQVRAGQTLLVLTSPPQIFEISTVNTSTSLTLTVAANPAISAGTRYAILTTDALSVDGLAQSIAQLISDYDESSAGWEAFAGTSANQTVTVSINGVSVTIPALGKLAQRGTNGAVPITHGGTGSSSPFGDGAGSFCQGNDVRLGTVNGKSGGIITGLTRNAGALIVTSNDGYLYQANGSHLSWDPVTGVTDFTNGRGLAAGGIRFRIINADASIKCAFSMSQDGNGYAVNGNWVSATSGRDTKDNIQEIENPRDKMRLIKAATWTYKSKAMSGRFGIGVIADELYEAFPEARITVGDVELDDGSIVEEALSVQAGDSGVTAALHHATILSLMDENESQQVEIEALKSNLEELKKIVEQLIAQ